MSSGWVSLLCVCLCLNTSTAPSSRWGLCTLLHFTSSAPFLSSAAPHLLLSISTLLNWGSMLYTQPSGCRKREDVSVPWSLARRSGWRSHALSTFTENVNNGAHQSWEVLMFPWPFLCSPSLLLVAQKLFSCLSGGISLILFDVFLGVGKLSIHHLGLSSWIHFYIEKKKDISKSRKDKPGTNCTYKKHSSNLMNQRQNF